VNTSFNIHEEPIVNSYADAIKGFFESGLDYLYMDGIIVSLEENYQTQSFYLNQKLKKKTLESKNISTIEYNEKHNTIGNTVLYKMIKKILGRYFVI